MAAHVPSTSHPTASVGLGVRARTLALRLADPIEAFARQVPLRPAVAGGLAGGAVALIHAPTGLLVGLVVGFVMLHRRTGFSFPLTGPDVLGRPGVLVGRALVAMFFIAPIATAGLVLPGFRNPATFDRYVSILVAEPSSFFNLQTAFPYPGTPFIVLLSLALVGYGMWRPRSRRHLIALVAGLGLFLASPTLSSVLQGDPGLFLNPAQYEWGMYAVLVGAGLLVAAHLRRPNVPSQETVTVRDLDVDLREGNLLMGAALVAVPMLAFVDGGFLAFAGISFELLHHTVAEVLAMIFVGATTFEAVRDEEEHETDEVFLGLRNPAGATTSVFTSGWVFGARCVLDPGTDDERDVSDQVMWSGTGTFSPGVGATSRPAFGSAGTNTIRLTYEGGSSPVVRDFVVDAVSPAGYAHVGMVASAPADAHGCPACPHPVAGPIETGSGVVTVAGLPAARKGDHGQHAACCGPNTYRIAGGDPKVLINGRPAAKIGSPTAHCGGAGEVGG